MSRYQSVQVAVPTPFDKMFVVLEYDLESGRPVGAWIAHKLKNESSEVTKLVEALSQCFHDSIKQLAQEYAYVEAFDEDEDSLIQSISHATTEELKGRDSNDSTPPRGR